MLDPAKQNQPAEEIAESTLPQYTPVFERTRWTHAGANIDRFFDHFVPSQYENGFSWRCRVIGKGEEERVVPFAEQPERIQRIIAGNAEVLLELYEETKPADLDSMREIGKRIAQMGIISADQDLDVDNPALRDDMSRRHHEKWLAQFNADLAAGRRSDPDHRGAKPFNELPDIELTVMKVQTWGNWRILGQMTDDDYALIRDLSDRRCVRRERVKAILD